MDQKWQEIAAIHVNPVTMLSVQTQLTVQRKEKLVTDAALTFSALGKDLVACTRLVEIRNSQVAHGLRQDITNKVISNEKDVLLRTVMGTSKSWEDCVSELVEAE